MRSEANSGRGRSSKPEFCPSPKNASHFSTLPQGEGEVYLLDTLSFPATNPRYALRQPNPVVAAAFEHRSARAEGNADRAKAPTAMQSGRMVGGLPVGRSSRSPDRNGSSACGLPRRVRRHATGRARKPERPRNRRRRRTGSPSGAAFDAMAHRHDRRFALGRRRERTAAAACDARPSKLLITCSALDTANAPGLLDVELLDDAVLDDHRVALAALAHAEFRGVHFQAELAGEIARCRRRASRPCCRRLGCRPRHPSRTRRSPTGRRSCRQPFWWMASEFWMKPGRCLAEQVGVKAPGSAKTTTFYRRKVPTSLPASVRRPSSASTFADGILSPTLIVIFAPWDPC